MQLTKVNREHPRNNPFVPPRGDSRPICSLPVELLTRIFRLGVSNDTEFREIPNDCTHDLLEKASREEKSPGDASPEDDSDVPFQVAVSHVCRQWRDVAILTPSLWTDIRVDTDSDTARPPYVLVSLHLERSRHLPLDITIHGHSPALDLENVNQPCGHVNLLAVLLVPHLHRWRSIEIKCINPYHTSAFLEPICTPSTTTPEQLESIRLYDLYELQVFHGASMLWEPEVRILFNGSAPQLKHLRLLSSYINWNQSLISAASNLTSLELLYHLEPGQPSWSQFSTMLRGAPGLQKLALHHSGPVDPVLWMEELDGPRIEVEYPIPLFNLTELVLGSQPEHAAIELLRKLYMPALTTLILNFDDEDADYSNFVRELTMPATTLTPSSSSSPDPNTNRTLLSNLERLAILNLSCKDEDAIANMLDQLDRLKVLRLPSRDVSEEDPMTESILETLVPRGHSYPDRKPNLNTVPVLCAAPQLESLFVCPTLCNWSHVRMVVKMRHKAGIPLKSLYVSRDHDGTGMAMLMKGGTWFEERVEEFGVMEEVHSWNTELAFDGYR